MDTGMEGTRTMLTPLICVLPSLAFSFLSCTVEQVLPERCSRWVLLELLLKLISSTVTSRPC